MRTYLASVAAFVQAGGPAAGRRVDSPQARRQVAAQAQAPRSGRPEEGVLVSISDEALNAARERGLADRMVETRLTSVANDRDSPEEDPAAGLPSDGREMSDEDLREIAELKQRELTVRTRDMAWVAATTGVSGGFTVRYETGPDGRRYAVEAEVRLDTTEAATPEQSLAKARAVRAALMGGGGDDSSQASAAARAAVLESRARAELARQRKVEQELHQAAPEPALPEVELDTREA